MLRSSTAADLCHVITAAQLILIPKSKGQEDRVMNRWQELPFAPARFPIFYGWVIVVVGAIGMLMSIPGQTMGISVFTDPLIGALDLTRVELSTAYMIGTILSAFALPRAGVICDRLGSRLLAAVSAFMLAMVLLVLSRIDAISARAIMITGWTGATVPFVVIAVAFFGLRFFGQGVLTVASNGMIMQWFEKRRGLANSISGTIVAFGFSGAPIILNLLVSNYGWRGAWVVMAAIIGVGFVILSLAFFRDKPESCGLLPDGVASKDEESFGEVRGVEDYDVREAVRTLAFWVITLTIAMSAFYLTGLTFHLLSIFREAGFSESRALAIFLPATVIAVSLHLVAGWLSDHIKIKYFVIFMLTGQIISMGGFILLSSEASYWAIVIGNGMSNGMFGVLSAVTWPKYFGRKHLSSIMSRSMSLVVFSSALGPLVFGQSLAITGGYRVAGVMCFLASCLLVVVATKLADPGMRSGQQKQKT